MINPDDRDAMRQAGSNASDPPSLDTRDAGQVAGPDPERALLEAILANLGREICRPLGLLREGIGQLVDDSTGKLTEAERGQAQTMLTLCDELRRLTRESLGG